MSPFKTIHSLFRCCLHCGSFQCNNSLFCQECEARLWTRHRKPQDFGLFGNKLNGTALFDWIPDQDRKVSKLMIALKGGRLVETLDYYAENFIAKLRNLQGNDSLAKTVLVPCPNTKGRRHAHRFAEAISKHLGIPVIDAMLLDRAGSSQKSKSALNRFEVRMTCSDDLSGKHVIFIDDIVTTGATALSARNALSGIVSFHIWCLAHRRQLATEGGV